MLLGYRHRAVARLEVQIFVATKKPSNQSGRLLGSGSDHSSYAGIIQIRLSGSTAFRLPSQPGFPSSPQAILLFGVSVKYIDTCDAVSSERGLVEYRDPCQFRFGRAGGRARNTRNIETKAAAENPRKAPA